MREIRMYFVALLGLFFLLVAFQGFAQEDVVKKRRSLMKSNNKSVRAIKRALAKMDYATIEAKAKVIIGNMDRVLDLFPEGSTSKKSRAKPEIWEMWDTFKQRRLAVKTAAEALAKAAAAKDEAEVKAQAKAIGRDWLKGACGNCHETFLKRKKKKKKT